MSRDAYAIRLDRRFDREAARIVRSQINRARRGLKAGDDTGVHTARKALKRARAALRLFRGGLHPDRFREVDHTMRRIGRRTGPVRDAVVALDLTDELEASGEIPNANRLRAYLIDRHTKAWATLDARGGTSALRDDLADLRLTKHDTAGMMPLAMHDGLSWTYGSGRRRLALAVEDPHAEALHAWRKRVKHLGYQFRILMPTWPLVIRATARSLDALGETLGRDHDLAEWARIAKKADLGDAALDAVHDVAKRQRQRLQTDLWPLSARIYAEEPGPFASRHTVYLAAALAEASGAPIHPLDGMALPAPPNRPLVIA